MKLGTIVAFSMALALPATINAQGDVIFSQSFDATGVNLTISDAHASGQVAIFMSTDGDDSWTDLGILRLNLSAPVLLAYDEASALGTYNLRIWVDTQALVDMGLTVYLQAVSVGHEDAQPDQGLPIRISEQVEIDFGAEQKQDPQSPKGEPKNRDNKRDDDDDDAKEDGR